MAKIPPIEEKKKKRVYLSPLIPIPELGRISIHGRTVIFADGEKMQFPTREGAWKAFKQARKENGESF